MAKRRRKPRLTAKQRRRRRTLFRVLWTLAIVVLVHLGKNNLVRIKDIQVNGNKKVSRQTILKVAKLEEGQKLYAQDRQVIEKRLEQIPYVKEAKVKGSLRGIVTMDITERTPIAQVNFRDHYVFVDEDLRLLEKTMQFQPEYIKITGLSMKNVRLGTYLFHNDRQKDLGDMVKALLQGNLAAGLQSIEVTPSGLNVLTKDDIQVVFSSTKNGSYKVKQLEAVLEKIKTMDKDVTMILMDKGKDPIAVTENVKNTKIRQSGDDNRPPKLEESVENKQSKTQDQDNS